MVAHLEGEEPRSDRSRKVIMNDSFGHARCAGGIHYVGLIVITECAEEYFGPEKTSRPDFANGALSIDV